MPGLEERTRLGPPGVDVEAFSPIDPGDRRAELEGLAGSIDGDDAGFGRDPELARERPALLRRRRGPPGDLRRQADRLQGLRPAARRLAPGRGRQPRGAAAPGRLRRVPGDARAALGGARTPATSTPPARSPGAAARSRAGRRASCPTSERSSTRFPTATRMPPRRRRGRSTSPAASSTPRSPGRSGRATRWSSRAPSRRRSGWSPPRPRRPGPCPSAPATAASPRSRAPSPGSCRASSAS